MSDTHTRGGGIHQLALSDPSGPLKMETSLLRCYTGSQRANLRAALHGSTWSMVLWLINQESREMSIIEEFGCSCIFFSWAHSYGSVWEFEEFTRHFYFLVFTFYQTLRFMDMLLVKIYLYVIAHFKNNQCWPKYFTGKCQKIKIYAQKTNRSANKIVKPILFISNWKTKEKRWVLKSSFKSSVQKNSTSDRKSSVTSVFKSRTSRTIWL